MAKHRFHVKLPTGEKVWLIGNTISEAFCAGFEKYAALQPPPKKKRCPTLRAYGDKRFRLYHQPKVKRNTANNTRILLERHIYPALGSRRMDDLTFDDIQALYNSKAALSHSTNQKLQIVLGAIFRNSLEDGLIDKNIMLSSRYVMSKHRGIRNCLTQADAADILRQVEHLNEGDQPFIMLPMLTGMRRGECLGLMWSDIDFAKRIITVNRAITFAGNQPVVDHRKARRVIGKSHCCRSFKLFCSRCLNAADSSSAANIPSRNRCISGHGRESTAPSTFTEQPPMCFATLMSS